MNFRKRTFAFASLLLLLTAVPILGQQKQQTPPRPQPKAAPTPAPTFDTVLPADNYIIYGEARNVGQLIRSNTINELLEPVMKLAGPPNEFRSLVKWVNAHADEVTSARLFVAAGTTNKAAPDTLVGIEFPSPEEAEKFVKPLNEFLPALLPNSPPDASPNPAAEPEKSKTPTPAKPNFHMERFGSLVLITEKPWTMKQLKPAGSKLLSEDVNFRTARNRFNSEPLFVYLNFKAMDRQDEERRKSFEPKRVEEPRVSIAENPPEKGTLVVTRDSIATSEVEDVPKAVPVPSEEPAKESATPDPIWQDVSRVGELLFTGGTEMPEGLALALSFEADSFDLRALLLNPPDKKAAPIPFWPIFSPGAAIAPQSPSVLAADTEVLVMVSLDLQQIVSELAKIRPATEFKVARGESVPIPNVRTQSALAAIEDRLKLNLKDDLLPLLGSEIAIRFPMQFTNGLTGIMLPSGIGGGAADSATSGQYPVLAIAVKDRERLRELIPRIIDSLGFKGASSFARTERRDDTEIVTYPHMFAYAFVGNFLVLSQDRATTQYIVDSYLKQETLAGDTNYKNFTRWQPREVQGQIYVSPALMESYKTWATQPTTRMSDQTRAFMTRLGTMAQPITYSLSNEGLGPLHELHVPKNLVFMLIAGISAEINPPPRLQNERAAFGLMYAISIAEKGYQKTNGSFGTLEQLIGANLLTRDSLERSGYKFDVIVIGDKYEATAVPAEYGKSGTLSLFIDETQVLRGADRSGAPATVSDPPIN